MLPRLLILLLLTLPGSAATRYFTDRAGAPVQWMEWGPAAIARAQKEGRPLFVSIGFAASWDAYRMQREAFLNGENAEALNAYFVPVVLDAIEHPELAETLQRITGMDAVPLNVLLTPSLQPFASTGYVDGESLGRLLVIQANRWATERGAVEAEAHANVQKARLSAERRMPSDVDATTMEAVVDAIAKTYAQTKTLDPITISFLIRYADRTKHAPLRALAIDTLRNAALSKRRDVLGGGFFRCDGCFDKLLSDQALYTFAALDADLPQIAKTNVEYAIRDLRLNARGAFEASQDAHSLVPAQGPVFVNGAFYEWTPEEVTRIAGREEAPAALAWLAQPALDLTPALQKLLTHRQKRPAPYREPLIVARWNGLMISAAARTGFREEAVAAANAVKTLTIAEDYAAMIQGALDLFEATYDVKWLEQAIALQQKQDRLFWDASAGRYVTGTTVPESLRGLLHETDDGTPSVNATSAVNLLRLAALTQNANWRARPAMIFTSFGGNLRANGDEYAALAHAYELSLIAPRIVVVTGDARKRETHDLLATFPNEPMRTVVILPHKGPLRDRIVRTLPYLANVPVDAAPAAYCDLPTRMTPCVPPTASLP